MDITADGIIINTDITKPEKVSIADKRLDTEGKKVKGKPGRYNFRLPMGYDVLNPTRNSMGEKSIYGFFRMEARTWGEAVRKFHTVWRLNGNGLVTTDARLVWERKPTRQEMVKSASVGAIWPLGEEW